LYSNYHCSRYDQANFEDSNGQQNCWPRQSWQLTMAQVKEIAEKKLADLNTTSLESAMHSVAGTARSMGVEVTA